MSEGMSKRIRELRKERGMTLEQVAEIVGVGKSTVRKWETGIIANMRRDKIASLANALGTTPAYLMGWENQYPYEISDEENPYELELRDTFEGLDVENQIYVKNWVNAFARNPELVKVSPDEQPLTEGEKMLLDLFRKVPAEQQQLVLQMIRAAISTQESC